jgi:hypothetical protein
MTLRKRVIGAGVSTGRSGFARPPDRVAVYRGGLDDWRQCEGVVGLNRRSVYAQ